MPRRSLWNISVLKVSLKSYVGAADSFVASRSNIYISYGMDVRRNCEKFILFDVQFSRSTVILKWIYLRYGFVDNVYHFYVLRDATLFRMIKIHFVLYWILLNLVIIYFVIELYIHVRDGRGLFLRYKRQTDIRIAWW